MRRALWEMPDNEIVSLLDRAIMVLDELYLKLHAQEDMVEFLVVQLSHHKKRSPEWHHVNDRLWQWRRDLEKLEDRIKAQESIVASFRNEAAARNPPFWTRSDLDRINRQR